MSDVRTILIIDDEEPKRRGLADYITLLGHKTIFAEEGMEGLASAKHLNPDLILLDLHMPNGMGGLECLQLLKYDSNLRKIPVIIVSGKDSDKNVVQCLEFGAEDFLPIPPVRAILEARIKNALDRYQKEKDEAILRDQLERLLLKVKDAERTADQLLHAIFPSQIANELKNNGEVKPRRYENVAVLFTDIVEFTTYCNNHEPEEVVGHLQGVVDRYETIAKRHGLEKIKTIGDAFMATAGLLNSDQDAILNAVKCGIEMVAALEQVKPEWQVRVGIHVGSVMAGKIGTTKFLFDVWGDTVNIASRIEGACHPGEVWVSKVAWEKVANQCHGTTQGVNKLKGIRPMELFRVERVRGFSPSHTPQCQTVKSSDSQENELSETTTSGVESVKPTIFISYSHLDVEWMERLVTHLAASQGMLDVWDDRRIEAGDEWEQEIETALGTAKVAMLLISANFLSSKFILRNEIPRLLERRDREGLRVIPVIVKPCTWKNVKWLGRLQARPKDGRPLSAGDDHQIDADLTAIADEVLRLAD